MEEFLTHYAPISVNVLTEGMLVDFEVYYKHKNEYVLLFNNIRVTPFLLTKIHRILNTTGNIYVPKEHRASMLTTRMVAEAKTFEKYHDIQNSQGDFLTNVETSGKVDKKETRKLADNVQDVLATVDTSLILQSISILREADDYLQTHCANVSMLNGIIGRWAGFSSEEIDILIQLGILHDIGKLKLDQSILNKPGKLDKTEFEHIKQHTTFGFDTLMKSGVTEERLLMGTLQHHERLNGEGYPHGLSAEGITKFARITAVSDVYDAMVAKRVYKRAYSPFEILKQFSEGQYSELDIEYVSIFLDSMCHELKGKTVLLSDGSAGEVIYINRTNYEFPMVKVDNEVIQTDGERCCVSLIESS